MALNTGDPDPREQKWKHPAKREEDPRPAQPNRHRLAACAWPRRFPKGQAKITGKTLDRRSYRFKAPQEMKTVVGQPHAEPERNQGIREAGGYVQPGLLELPQPTTQRCRDADQEHRQYE